MSYKTQLSRLFTPRAPLSAAITAISLSFGGAAVADEYGKAADQNRLEQQQHSASSEYSEQSPTSQSPTSQTTTAQSTAQSASTAQTTQSEQSDGAKAVAALAEQEESLKTFTKALQESGIADGLAKDQKYTVFAPTDEAFESASGRSAEELLQPENRTELIELLRAHIVADDVDMEMAEQISEARTIDGGTVKLTVEDDTLKVGDASVAQSSVQEGMLRIYPIDALLEPQSGAEQTASAGSGSRQAEPSQQSADFDELDQNGDGYLSEQELASSQVAQESDSDEMDTDDDGQVSRTEFSAFERNETSSMADDDQR